MKTDTIIIIALLAYIIMQQKKGTATLPPGQANTQVSGRAPKINQV